MDIQRHIKCKWALTAVDFDCGKAICGSTQTVAQALTHAQVHTHTQAQ